MTFAKKSIIFSNNIIKERKMKKLFILSILISSMTFANKVYTENDIFIKEGKAYTLVDEKVITNEQNTPIQIRNNKACTK